VINDRSKIRVTADMLNVRSTPESNGPIIRQVQRNDLLILKQNKSYWSLVVLPDGSSGWVMTQYTVSTADEPKG